MLQAQYKINVFPFPQGSMFGGIALFENICFMVGSVAGGAIYSETVAFLPGFAFWVMAGYNVIALFLLMWVSRLILKTWFVAILKVYTVFSAYEFRINVKQIGIKPNINRNHNNVIVKILLKVQQ